MEAGIVAAIVTACVVVFLWGVFQLLNMAIENAKLRAELKEAISCVRWSAPHQGHTVKCASDMKRLGKMCLCGHEIVADLLSRTGGEEER